MDAVYVLGKGSSWYDLELLYSLRSLATYITGIDRVFIVGFRPKWIKNVIHIPQGDPHACKERNIAEKVLTACRDPRLSKLFLFLNDDHLALAPQPVDDIPAWRGGDLLTLAGKLTGGNYRLAMYNTHDRLKERGLSTWNFDVHTPMVMDRDHFTNMMASYNWEERFVLKSLYANTVGIPGVPYTDLKIDRPYMMRELVRVLRGRAWWSHGPGGMTSNLRALLASLYPAPSPWEAH
jgi:hypothetical protein